MIDITTRNKDNYFFRQLLFIIALIAVGVIIWNQLGYLVSSFLGAFTIYVVLRTPYYNLVEKKNWKPWLASLLFVIATVVLLLAVGFLVYELVASQVPNLNTQSIIDGVGNISENINEFLGFSLISKDIFSQFKNTISGLVSNIFNTTYNFVINLLLMIFILYFMFVHGRKMERTILKYFPFDGKSLGMIKSEVKKMIFSNAVGIPVVMTAQALVSLLGYWIVGIDRMFFWAFLTAICGLIPLVGTGIVWVPMTIYQFATGNIWQGVVLGLYSLIVLANTDNACRLVLMKVMANTHPLIVIFGVLLGIPLFGFWGIIFGPLLISGFLLLVKIYYMEYEGIEPEEEDLDAVQSKDKIFKKKKK